MGVGTGEPPPKHPHPQFPQMGFGDGDGGGGTLPRPIGPPFPSLHLVHIHSPNLQVQNQMIQIMKQVIMLCKTSKFLSYSLTIMHPRT